MKPVQVEIIGDKYAYKNKASELGYSLHADHFGILGDTGYYLILYPETKQYNILSKLDHKELTQEEFFNMTNRKNLDLQVLEVIVNQVCDTLDNFSAYNVTEIVRKRLPGYNIKHEEVKSIVENYVTVNNLYCNFNGLYRTFSKSTTCCNSINVGGVNQQPFISKLQKLLSEKSKKNKKQPLSNIIKTLQSEGRVSLTEEARKLGSQVYINKQPQKIIISALPTIGSQLLQTSGEIRLRTGFNTNKVRLNISAGRIEVEPA